MKVLRFDWLDLEHRRFPVHETMYIFVLYATIWNESRHCPPSVYILEKFVIPIASGTLHEALRFHSTRLRNHASFGAFPSIDEDNITAGLLTRFCVRTSFHIDFPQFIAPFSRRLAETFAQRCSFSPLHDFAALLPSRLPRSQGREWIFLQVPTVP